jgi:hypothetical protein
MYFVRDRRTITSYRDRRHKCGDQTLTMEILGMKESSVKVSVKWVPPGKRGPERPKKERTWKTKEREDMEDQRKRGYGRPKKERIWKTKEREDMEDQRERGPGKSKKERT